MKGELMTQPRAKRVKRYKVQFFVKDIPKFKLNENFCPIDELKKWIEEELLDLPAGVFIGKVSIREVQ
jgi:hypothetical protein